MALLTRPAALLRPSNAAVDVNAAFCAAFVPLNGAQRADTLPDTNVSSGGDCAQTRTQLKPQLQSKHAHRREHESRRLKRSSSEAGNRYGNAATEPPDTQRCQQETKAGESGEKPNKTQIWTQKKITSKSENLSIIKDNDHCGTLGPPPRPSPPPPPQANELGLNE